MFKKRNLLALLLCAFMVISTLGLPVSALSVQKTPSRNAIEGEVIVSIVAQGSQSGIFAMNQRVQTHEKAFSASGFIVKDSLDQSLASSATNGIRINSAVQSTAIRNMGHVYLLKYTNEYGSFAQAAKALREDLANQGIQVKYIEPNYRVYALGIGKASVNTNQAWHYNMIKAPEAWIVTPGSSAVKIAVLDTGIDTTHPNLQNYISTSLSRNFTGGSTTDVTDRQGHGTHVAGTIASYGSVSGVMQVATLVAVKVLGDDGSGSTYGIVEGILYASQIGADAINMSLGGGGFDQSMADACKTASQNGTVVVAATGNDGASTVSYPGAYPYVIGVGSVTNTRARSSFSNYGTGLDVMAPGSDIYSTKPGGGFQTMSGTSMATPHVAGVVGLIRSANKSLTAAQVEDILKRTCQPAGSASQYGSGIVDAYAAVLAANGDTPVEKATATTLTTNKATYVPGESVTVTAVVKDTKGVALNGAAVKLTTTAPNGTTTVNSGTSNASGLVSWSLPTSTSSAVGQYSLRADTTLTGYASSYANGSYRLENTSQNVTVTGSAYSDLKKWMTISSGYYKYNTSAVIYVVLSDGTYHKHGTISASSWYSYPNLSKKITGTAIAANGQRIAYSMTVRVSAN